MARLILQEFERPAKITLIPIRAKIQRESFDLVGTILSEIELNGNVIQEGDIIVVSSKYVAMSERRMIKLSTIRPSRKARRLGSIFTMQPELAQLVLKEADLIYGGVRGFALTVKDGVTAPNAGVDRSNIFPGWAILHPKKPFEKARDLREEIHRRTGQNVGIVITDSRLMPTRVGTSGVAIGVSGFEPVLDDRGRKDLFGNTLKVTQRAIADDISSAAQLLMGEADERIPIVIARGMRMNLNSRKVTKARLVMPPSRCIFVRGLSRGVLMRKE